MMNQKIIDILEICIRQMNAGIPLEVCLKNYPELAHEVRELLETAHEINTLCEGNVPTHAMANNRIALIQFAENLRNGKKTKSGDAFLNRLVTPIWQFLQTFRYFRSIAGRLIVASVVAGIFIFFSGGLLITSAKSLPGDSLYPVKRAVEVIKVSLAPSKEIRHDFEDAYNQKRVEEVRELIGLSRMEKISFGGIIISHDGSLWQVSGIPVIILPETKIIGAVGGSETIVPGAKVEVEGNINEQGQVLADEIHLREFQFIGIVEDIRSEVWLISGSPYLIIESSQIDPGIQIGDEVMVLVLSEDDGVYALAILGEAHPIVTVSPMQINESNSGIIGADTDVQIIQGMLEKIGENYWVINGHNYYIVFDTKMSEGIRIGDVVLIKYQIEANGSFTAVEIEQENEDGQSVDLGDVEKTEEAKGDEGTNDGEATSTEEEKRDKTKTPEPTEKPEATETPEPTENH